METVKQMSHANFIFALWQRLDLRSLNNVVALQSLSITNGTIKDNSTNTISSK